MFKPIRVTIATKTPVCLGHPWLHLDGLLGHVIMRRELGESYYTLPSKKPLRLDRRFSIRMPIARVRHPRLDDWFYRASVSFFDSDKLYASTIYKRFHEAWSHRVATRKTKIMLGKGFYRLHMIKLPYRPAGRVVFYAYGNPREVEDLLSDLPGLGKKTVIGFGGIREVTVEEIDRDMSLVDEHGRAMRPLPIWAVAEADDVVPLAYKPPYWSKYNVKPCAPPGARVVLQPWICRSG